jgi:hypothetical protein
MLNKIVLFVPAEHSSFRIYRTFFAGLVKSYKRLGVERSVVEGGWRQSERTFF